MKTNTLLLSAFLTINIYISYSQTKKDSIESQIEKGHLLAQIFPDSSRKILISARQKAINTGYKDLVASSELSLGCLNAYQGDFKKSDSIFKHYIKSSNSDIIKGRAHSFLGVSYQWQSKLKASTTELFEARKYFEKLNDSAKLFTTYVNLGNIFMVVENQNEGIESYEKSLKLCNNKLLIYKPLILSNMSGIYCELGELTKCVKTANEAVKLQEEITTKSPYYPFMLGNLGLAYSKKNNHNLAITLLEKSLQLSKEVYHDEIINSLITSYITTSQTTKALKHAKNLIRINDSLYKTKQEKEIAELTKKYNFEKVRTEKVRAEKKEALAKSELLKTKAINQLYLFAITLLAFFVLGIFIFVRNRNRNQKLQLKNTQLSLKLSQLNPHFLSNALTSIQSLILQKKTNEASDVIVDLSRVMRDMFNLNENDFITVADDFKFVQNFIHLKQQLLRDNATLNINKEEGVDNYKIPAMFTQPLVENAIEHGIFNLNNGIVTISYSQTHTHIIATIFDNGGRFQKNNANKNVTKSSTTILKERIALYKKRNNYTIQMTTISNVDNGTEVRILFPKQL